MYNEIVDKVAEQLSILFPPEQGYYIYTEAAAQELSSPCFYTGFLETSEKNTTFIEAVFYISGIFLEEANSRPGRYTGFLTS